MCAIDQASARRARTTHRGARANARQSKAGPKFAVVAGADAVAVSFTSEAYSWLRCLFVGDIFDFENLLPQLILALGLALLIGNGLAWWKHRRGEAPKDVPDAQYRPGRVGFLMVVGLVLTIWGSITLFT